LDIRVTHFVGDSVASSMNLLTFASSTGASTAEHDAFWTAQLLKLDVVVVLEAATLFVGELTCLEHIGLSLHRVATRISDEAATTAATAANAAAVAAAAALALASGGGGPIGAGGTHPAAGSFYSFVALSGKQSAEADLRMYAPLVCAIRTDPAFVACIRYPAQGIWDLARAQFGPQAVPSKATNMLLRLMTSLTEKSEVDNKECTTDRKQVYDRLQVTKLVTLMSAHSRRSRR
jgi:hypothetical protein